MRRIRKRLSKRSVASLASLATFVALVVPLVGQAQASTSRHRRGITINLRHSSNNNLIVSGKVTVPDGYNDCRKQVPIEIQFKTRSGEYVTKKTGSTDERGRYSVEVGDITGRWRARAPRFRIADHEEQRWEICNRAQDGAWHRHRNG